MPDLDHVSRTALVPFWARVQDARSAAPILGDNAAASLAGPVRERFSEIEIARSTEVGCCLRNRLVDEWVTEILSNHGDSTVVDIGVGLDTRLRRRPNIAGRYVEVDSAPIVDLREQLLPDTEAVRVSGDGMRPEVWIDRVNRNPSALTVIVLEGVLAYQKPNRVARFFAEAAQLLPGAHVMFDSLSPCSVWLANRSGEIARGRPRYQWSAWRTKRIAAGTRRLRIVEEKGFMDFPPSVRRSFNATDRLVHAVPPMRRSYRLTLAQLPK